MIVDAVLLALLLWAAASGWHRGFVVRGLQLVGLLGAGALAYHWTPRALDRMHTVARPGVPRTVLLVLVTIAGAMVGEAVLGRIGRRMMRGHHGARPDRALGSLASMVTVLFVAWFATTGAAPVLPAAVARQVAASRGLHAVDTVMPETPRRWASDLATSVNEERLPDVFTPLSPEPAAPVPAPATGVAALPAVRAAAASVVRVLATSDACGGFEGSGWVVATHRVVTNAHVVAGATDVRVQVRGVGRRLRATVVGYDPRTDLAVLEVPDLTASPLRRAEPALAKGSDVVVAGFPLDGAYSVVSGRVRDEIDATGRDIYSSRPVIRTIYSVRAVVRPGNSGGPLLTTGGRVAGTVFARSTTDADTGYALSDAATDSWLDRAASLTTPVSTQSCTSG